MAATESEMLELGTPAPEFSLPDPDGQLHSLGDGRKAYVVMFICNHCPFVKHIPRGARAPGPRLPVAVRFDGRDQQQ